MKLISVVIKMWSTTLLLAFVGITFAEHPDMIDGPECMPNISKMHEERECCEMPPSSTHFKTAMKECMQELNIQRPSNGGPPSVPPPNFECVDECVFKKNSLLNDKSQVDEILIKNAYNDTIEAQPAEWKEVSITALNKCVSLALKEAQETTSECKSGSHQFHRCFKRETFLNCPTKFWKDNEVCKALKARLEKCPHAVPPPPNRQN